MTEKRYEIDVARVIDVKNSIALVQMTDKRSVYLQTDRIPRDKLKEFYSTLEEESEV